MAVAAEQQTYVNVDNLAHVADARQAVREHAWALVYKREQLLASGEAQSVPLTIDALSTADEVLAAKAGSAEYHERLDGLQLDCRRLVAEWYRKKRPEYFPPSRHFFDAATGDFYSHGLSIRQMTENGLRPIDNDPEEEARRVNERVENETPLLMRKLGGVALAGAALRTISECTDKAISDYQHDKASGARHRGYGGYVPEKEKLMIRDMRFDEVSEDRFEEQLGLPGIYINHYVIQQALKRRDVNAGKLTKTELHGTQLLVRDDLMEFAQLLDDVASEEWCVNLFMGEVVPSNYQKDYAGFRAEALRRQERLQDLAGHVTTFILDLAADGFDRRKAPAHVEAFVKKLLLEEAKADFDIAVQMFDEQTAVGLQEVVRLEQIGEMQAAFALWQEVEKQAPGGGYCSGGSCGLESVDLFGPEGEELSEQLEAEPGDTVVRDKERSCRRCQRKSVVYAYNKSKVNKYCESCGAFESKRTR